MKRVLYLLFAVFSALYFLSCTPSNKISGSWKNPELDTSTVQNVFIAAITQNMEARQKVENHLAEELKAKGVQTTLSHSVFPPDLKPDSSNRQMIIEKIKQTGADAILTISLLDQKSETRYVPGTSYAPVGRYGYYGSFYGYYNYAYGATYSPGYYTTDKTYFLETNLYDIESQKLLWSAQSQSYNPSSIDKAASRYAELVADKLQDDKIVRKN